MERAAPWRGWLDSPQRKEGAPRAPSFFFFLGFFKRRFLAAQEFLSQGGQLVVRQFALLVQLHFGLRCLAAAALAFLSYVSLVVRHPIPPNKLRPLIVADQEKEAMLGADFR